MTQLTPSDQFTSEDIAPHLPLLRRYARALTGSQSSGDAYVVATLEAIVADPTTLRSTHGARAALYGAFHVIWESAHLEVGVSAEEATNAEAATQKRLRAIAPAARQALLLTALENFSLSEAAAVMNVAPEALSALRDEAIEEIRRQTRADVLIIEDEPIIAADLEGIVEALGHNVVDIADTRNAAVAIAMDKQPSLVLADIQLADGSSGIDAVSDILAAFSVPVIFITAYPDRLLTGDRPEPTFLITKPFRNESVEAAIGQALFFGGGG